MHRTLATFAILASLPTLASAQLLSPVAQERFVAATAEGDDLVQFPSDSDRDDAVGFGLFTSTSSAGIEEPGEMRVSAGSSQTSEILPDSIVATGSGFSDCEISGGSLWLVGGVGESFVSVDFQVPTAVKYELSGSITAFDSGNIHTSLERVGGPSLFFSDSFGSGEVAVSTSGILTPGDTYRFVVAAAGGSYLDFFGFDFAFTEFDLNLELTALVENYCVAAPNSVGPGVSMGHSGSLSIASNDFQLESTGGLPGGSGLFYYGPGQVQTAFGDGVRCVGGMTFRLQPPIQNDAAGAGSRLVDFTSGPAAGGAGAILPGSAWNFQLWYRDPMGPGGTGFNASDGLSVVFCE